MKKIASKNFFPTQGDAQLRKITFISTSLAYAFSIAVAVVENALGKRYDESSNLLTLLNYLRGGVAASNAACNAFDCECLLNFILMRFRYLFIESMCATIIAFG